VTSSVDVAQRDRIVSILSSVAARADDRIPIIQPATSRCSGYSGMQPAYTDPSPRALIRNMRSRIFLSTVVLLLLAMTGAALSEPKRVLILHPFGRAFVPWSQYGKTVQQFVLGFFYSVRSSSPRRPLAAVIGRILLPQLDELVPIERQQSLGTTE
jgi:hypothetical protein